MVLQKNVAFKSGGGLAALAHQPELNIFADDISYAFIVILTWPFSGLKVVLEWLGQLQSARLDVLCCCFI